MELGPDGRHPPDRPGEPKDEEEVNATIGQIGLRSVGQDDLGIRHTCLLDPVLNVFHRHRIDVWREDGPPTPTILAAGTVKRPGPQPTSSTVWPVSRPASCRAL
jgi:hypothetical protein